MKKIEQSLISKISSLFALNKEPVLGIYDGMIVMCNPSAMRFFGKDLVNQPAVPIIPEHILGEEAESFVCSGTFLSKSATASVTHFDALTVLALTPLDAAPKAAALVPQSLVSALRSSAATMKISADQIINRIEFMDDDKLKRYASMLYHSYFTMLRLTVNLETINGLSDDSLPFHTRVWDMVTLCTDLISSVTHMLQNNSIPIRFSCDVPKIYASVDYKRIEQLILNLLTNSLMHTGPGDEIHLSLKKAGTRIILSVDDTGKGIPPRVLSTIFSRFDHNLTLAELAEGSGLGLNIAKGIAEKHGGALMIESRQGEGTTVRVMFPANLPEHGAIHSPTTEILNSMNDIMRELSVVLRFDSYDMKYMD